MTEQMANYLYFLNEYEIHLNISLEKYLSKANLTEKECKYLSGHISSLEVPYRIPLQSGEEILVVYGKIKLWDEEYTGHRVASAIASSMPYDTLVVLQNGEAVRFYAFERHKNSWNRGRSVIDQCRQSASVMFDRGNSIDKAMQAKLSLAFRGAKSADSIMQSLINGFSIVNELKIEEKKEMLRELGLTYMYDSASNGLVELVWSPAENYVKEQTDQSERRAGHLDPVDTNDMNKGHNGEDYHVFSFEEYVSMFEK